MIKVLIIGTGNVATQLTTAFLKNKNVIVVQQYSRKKEYSSIHKISITNNLTNLKDADVYIIAILDDAIVKVSKQLQLNNKLVVHTSGSVALEDLKCNARKGVFYPLQTISKNVKINFKKIPICIEAQNKKDYELLEKLGKLIASNIYNVNSEQRKQLHLAAVFVNNFTNHLYKIAEDICLEHHISFEILKPLIKETAKKIKYLSPKEVQTGPAKRNDVETIKTHLDLLNKEQQKIYNLISTSIINTYK